MTVISIHLYLQDWFYYLGSRRRNQNI